MDDCARECGVSTCPPFAEQTGSSASADHVWQLHNWLFKFHSVVNIRPVHELGTSAASPLSRQTYMPERASASALEPSLFLLDTWEAPTGDASNSVLATSNAGLGTLSLGVLGDFGPPGHALLQMLIPTNTHRPTSEKLDLRTNTRMTALRSAHMQSMNCSHSHLRANLQSSMRGALYDVWGRSSNS